MKKSGVIFIRSTQITLDSRVLKEANTLVKHGYSVRILGWNRENNDFSERTIKLNNGTAIIQLFGISAGYGDGVKGLHKLILFQLWVFFCLLILNRKYQIIHSCDFDTALPSLLITKLLRKKMVYDIFDYYTHSHYVPLKLEAFIENIEKYVINQADAVIICTESRYKQIEMPPGEKCIVIHNTPDLNLTDNIDICKSNSNKLKIVYVGLLQPTRLLEEMAKGMDRRNKIELHIGGIGELEEYFYGLSKEKDNVFYYGRLPYPKVLKLELECDILFATYDPTIKNHKFSAPNKIYEAMALRKPIIVCNNTGVDEMVRQINMGITIGYSAEEFWNAVDILANDRVLRDQMGLNGRKAYENNYSWNIMEDRLVGLYRDL